MAFLGSIRATFFDRYILRLRPYPKVQRLYTRKLWLRSAGKRYSGI